MSLYNEINNWQSGATGSDALGGASTGAAIGTAVLPGIGTAVGGLIGGAVGALSSVFGGGAVDPESKDVQNVINATAQSGNSTQAAQSASNPLLEMAGLFDRHESTLPMYQQFGRQGESKFSTAMINKINDAYQSGQINGKSSPQDVYNQVVAPWVNGMGSGYSTTGTTYTATTQGLVQDMVTQYMNGSFRNQWKSVGGDAVAANAPAYGSSAQATTDGTWITGPSSTPTQSAAGGKAIGNFRLPF